MTGRYVKHSQAGLRMAGMAALVLAGIGNAAAEVAFDAPDAEYKGQVRAAATEAAKPIVPGSEVELTGQNFKAGQEVFLLRGRAALLGDTIVADEEGKFSVKITLPADAVPGVHPLVVTTDKPYNAATFDLKISPDVPLSGEDKFEIVTAKVGVGLYQSAYSAKHDALFVGAAVGRPPVKQSALYKLNPETLEVVAEVTPAAAPSEDGSDKGLLAIYGVAVDDTNEKVWVTNTRQNTVAVYNQDDLSLAKQFEPGLVTHARDVAVDETNGKVYATPVGVPQVVVFDAKALEFAKNIDIATNVRGESFSPTSLQFDPKTSKLFVASMSTNEVAVIDTATDTVEKVLAVPGSNGSIGVAYDSETNSVFVVAQGSDNLVILNGENGEVLHDVPVGAGSLNVAFEPVSRLAFVSNRGAGTVTVVNLEGEIVANLDNWPYANHVYADGRGNIYAVNKTVGEDNPLGDRVTKITPKP